MRLIYTLIFILITPLIFLRLYLRGIKAPEYRLRWKERLAIYSQKHSNHVIWIHAVSLGEVEAVIPLVKMLQQRLEKHSFLITTTTPTGSARVKSAFADQVDHVYLPYDIPIVVNKFLTHFNPKIAIFMEKEIWPNIYAQCATYNIPLLIINARLSARSAKGYKKISALIKPALTHVNTIAAQTSDDKQRFIELGASADKVINTGNIKFDVVIDDQLIQQAKLLKKQLFPNRFVWIIASTHEGEESVFFNVYPKLKQLIPELLLMIVPRHPERFNSVYKMAQTKQLTTIKRSSGKVCDSHTDVYIADTMGELKQLYGTADLSFVGGSFVPVGGHNILEPGAMQVPVSFGPNMVNFKQIASDVIDLDAAVQCMNEQDLYAYVVEIYKNKPYANNLISNMNQFLSNNRGATKRTSDIIINCVA